MALIFNIKSLITKLEIVTTILMRKADSEKNEQETLGMGLLHHVNFLQYY